MADEVSSEVSILRAMVAVFISSPSQLPNLMSTITDEREVLESLLEQLRQQADGEIHLAQLRMSELIEENAATASNPPKGIIPPALAATERKGPPISSVIATPKTTTPSSSNLKSEEEEENSHERLTVPAPSSDLPAEAVPPPAPEQQGRPPTSSPKAIAIDPKPSSENLASILERGSWDASSESKERAVSVDERYGVSTDFGHSRIHRPRSRPSMPAAQEKRSTKPDGEWEEDLSSMLEQTGWEEAEADDDGHDDKTQPQASLEGGGLEDILSGYLKEVD